MRTTRPYRFDKLPKTIQNDYLYRYQLVPVNLWMDLYEDEVAAIEVVEKSTAPEKLLRWARHPQFRIREAVAANVHSPEEALDILAPDPLKYIRELVLDNPNTALATKLYIRLGGYGKMTVKEFKESVK